MSSARWIGGWLLAASSAFGVCAQAALQASPRAAAAQPAVRSTSPAMARSAAPSPDGLDVAEIIARNAAARGGVEAWRRIETMAWAGHVESANTRGRNLAFVLEQRRPNKARFEITAEGQKSIRTFDGTSGWKLRSAPGEKPDIQPYSAEELVFASGTQVIEGPLMDCVARDGAIAVLGVDAVGGRKAYVLEARLPVGGVHRIWVDAETFLELRHDREFVNASGRSAVTTVLYADYRPFEGLLLPVTIETGAAEGRPANKLVIERVALNPALGDRTFARPDAPVSRRNSMIVDTRGAAQGGGAQPPARRP
jgi:hypothetical protein